MLAGHTVHIFWFKCAMDPVSRTYGNAPVLVMNPGCSGNYWMLAVLLAAIRIPWRWVAGDRAMIARALQRPATACTFD